MRKPRFGRRTLTRTRKQFEDGLTNYKRLELARDVLRDAHNLEPSVTEIYQYADSIKEVESNQKGL